LLNKELPGEAVTPERLDAFLAAVERLGIRLVDAATVS
jgi:hypothetical protein